MRKFISNALKIGAGILIGSAMTVFASQVAQNVIVNDELSISVNGQVQTLRDETTNQIEYPLTYRDRTYIPLRSVAKLLGYKVGYIEATKTATVDSPDYVAPVVSTPAPTPATATPGDSRTVALNSLNIVSSLVWKDPPLSDNNFTMNSQISVANLINLIYQSPETNSYYDQIHHETPEILKNELVKDMEELKAIRARAGSTSFRCFVESSSVKFLKYGYRSDGRVWAAIVSYTLDINYNDANGNRQTEHKPLTSLIAFNNDTLQSDLRWVGHVVTE